MAKNLSILMPILIVVFAWIRVAVSPQPPVVTDTLYVGYPSWGPRRADPMGMYDTYGAELIFNVYDIVHKLSQVMTLEPCDIIATGTPAGVGFAMKPEPEFLNVGDIVEIEIQNIGQLRNRVGEQSQKAT